MDLPKSREAAGSTPRWGASSWTWLLGPPMLELAIAVKTMADRSGAMTILGFALGQNNFGGGRTRMADLIPEIQRHLAPGARLVAWHGHSGNVAVDFGDSEMVRAALRQASGRDWAVVPAEMVAGALHALGPIREEAGVRWTPGLAFNVETSVVVPVVKRDAMAGARLDKNRRDGGWGAISADVARQRGGRWTARSWRPVAGILQQL
jgi:hypothetical protein